MTHAQEVRAPGRRETGRWGRFATQVRDGRHAWMVAAVVFVYYVGVQLYYHGASFGHWDVLALSGWLTVALGLRASEHLPAQLRHTLRRLDNRDLLPSTTTGDELASEMIEESRRWSWTMGIVAAVAMLAAAGAAFSEQLYDRWPFLLFAIPGGLLVGRELGRMVAYGRLGAFLEARGALPQVLPGYIDGAGGLKPVGDFFFRQAMLLAIPAVYLGAWYFLIPVTFPRYGYWRQPYLWLLAIALSIEVVAFVAPMLRFHGHMVATKRALLDEADHRAREIAELEQVAASGTVEGADGVRDRVKWAADRFQAIESLPTWPVDARTRRRFSLNNAGLALPFVGHLVGQTEIWNALGNAMRNLQT
jgi:hypothetical protein